MAFFEFLEGILLDVGEFFRGASSLNLDDLATSSWFPIGILSLSLYFFLKRQSHIGFVVMGLLIFFYVTYHVVPILGGNWWGILAFLVLGVTTAALLIYAFLVRSD